MNDEVLLDLKYKKETNWNAGKSKVTSINKQILNVTMSGIITGSLAMSKKNIVNKTNGRIKNPTKNWN